MQELPNVSRRKALKLLVGAPMLPLGAFSVSTLLAGCGGDSATAPATSASFKSASFASMAAPSLADAAAMATTTVGSTLKIAFDNGSSTEYKLAYQPFFLTGDLVSDGKGGKVLAGGYYDSKNQPILDKSVPANVMLSGALSCWSTSCRSMPTWRSRSRRIASSARPRSTCSRV